MRDVGIGIIGCGNICGEYLNNMNRFKHVKTIAVADIQMERAKAVAEKYCVPKACTVDELLTDSDVEIVINLTFPQVHEEINTKVLNAGKNLYCEKPFCEDFEGVKRIMALAKEKNLLVGGAPDTFYGAMWQSVRKAIDDGWIGKPVSAIISRIHRGNETWHPEPDYFYKPGCGPMLDVGIYPLVVLISLLGPVKSLYCNATHYQDEREIYSKGVRRGEKMKVYVNTHYSATIEFVNGAIGTLLVSHDIWHSRMPAMEIHGTDGSLYLPQANTYMVPYGNPEVPLRFIRKEDMLSWAYGDDIPGWQENTSAGKMMGRDVYYKVAKEIPCFFETSGIASDMLRGLAVVDMAYSIVDNGLYRTNADFVQHCSEVLHAFDTSAAVGKPYIMTTICERPDPIPMGLGQGIFRKE